MSRCLMEQGLSGHPLSKGRGPERWKSPEPHVHPSHPTPLPHIPSHFIASHPTTPHCIISHPIPSHLPSSREPQSSLDLLYNPHVHRGVIHGASEAPPGLDLHSSPPRGHSDPTFSPFSGGTGEIPTPPPTVSTSMFLMENPPFVIISSCWAW